MSLRFSRGGLSEAWECSVNKRDIAPVAALLLIGSFAFTHLLAIPPFEDEGSQLRWIWRAIEAGEWLEPLSEGKPLEAWPMVPLAMLAPRPLVAIRALHVLSGMLGAVLTYLLARQFTGRPTAFASGVLFAICPFVVYLERFAHSDILLCTAGIWVLLSVVMLISEATWGRAAALAASLVLAALCKLPVGFLFLTSMPLALLIMPASSRRTLLHRPAVLKVLVAHAPALLLALATLVVVVVRTSRGQVPGLGVQDLLGIGFGRYPDIASSIGVSRPTLMSELGAQLSWPVVALGVVGVAAGARLNDWRQRWLIVVGAIPLLGIGLLANFWFSRYLLVALPPLIIAATCGWHSLLQRLPRYSAACVLALLALCVALMARQSALLVLDPLQARWSPLDRFQYFEGWGSGYGYPEAAQFLLTRTDTARMIYALDGHSAYQLRTYLPSAWRTRVRPVFYGQNGERLRSEAARLDNLFEHAPAWIVIPEPLLQGYLKTTFGEEGERIRLRRVAEFDKPGGRTQLSIYEATLRSSASLEPDQPPN